MMHPFNPGNLENCTVYVDVDGNQDLTYGADPSGLQTRERGWYISDAAAKLQGNFNLFVEPNARVEDHNDTRSCHNTATGLPLVIPLAAPFGSQDITPLTSLLVSCACEGKQCAADSVFCPPNVATADMHAAVIAAFGLNSSTSLGHTRMGADFQLMLAEHLVACTVTQVASMLAQSVGDVPKIAASVYRSLAVLILKQHTTRQHITGLSDVLDPNLERLGGSLAPRVELTNARTLSLLMQMTHRESSISTSQAAVISTGQGSLAAATTNSFALGAAHSQDMAWLLKTVVVSQVGQLHRCYCAKGVSCRRPQHARPFLPPFEMKHVQPNMPPRQFIHAVDDSASEAAHSTLFACLKRGKHCEAKQHPGCSQRALLCAILRHPIHSKMICCALTYEIRKAELPKPAIAIVDVPGAGDNGGSGDSPSAVSAAAVGGAVGAAIVVAAISIYAAFVLRRKWQRSHAHPASSNNKDISKKKQTTSGSFGSSASGMSVPQRSTGILQAAQGAQYDNPLYRPSVVHKAPSAAAPAELPTADEADD
eukprot:357663-Chlamydomonas_euryale.AAC.5